MAEFEAANHLVIQYYEAEFDRVLTFRDGIDFPAIQEAARARYSYCNAHYTSVGPTDQYIFELPPDLPRMAMNSYYLQGFLDLLDDYIEISFKHGSTKNPDIIAMNRERARNVVADLQLANQLFETVQNADFSMLFPGEGSA